MNCFRCESAEILAVMDRKPPFSEEVARAGWKEASDNPGKSVKLFVERRG